MFEFNGTASYQMKQQARCLSALEGDTDHNKFVVCSLELRGENELHVLDFNEDTNEVCCQRVYAHPNEVWACATCPAPEHFDLLITTHASGTELKTTLSKMVGLDETVRPDEDSRAADGGGQTPPPEAVPLEELLELPLTASLGESRGVLWNAVLPEQVVVLHAKQLRLYQLAHGISASTASEGISFAPPVDGDCFCTGRWDPHHAHALGLAVERTIMTVDTRTMKPAHTLPDAHTQRVRALDYNPNRPYVALSSGDDFAIKFWDLRKSSGPLHSQRAHSHWVTSASYNRFHDQLVLSSSSDSRVKLWRVSSLSSSPPSADEGEIDEGDADGLVKTFEEHDQSVFGTAWSAADAWIFASLSLDGKAVINHVPPAEKYKILL
ncbi:hypothetical protein AB1Y20_018948 [Prymnesium parvum]|uniref:EIPR1-like beta-propeller domain-containing protein n=1 Tax=Prymnesium parvum TaxID=97485 RepID=A0AB34JTY8_PRYPA|mmetsp:Transcript_18542/g.46442  ORF Transcript_18542/g.46442 Transcript_18542/m.46442 type:complete len:381 (-) Transcript_18542:451-1593(-)